MDVVAAGWGSAGDILPVVAIAGELCRRGHRVCFVGNRFFAAQAEQAGLEFAAVGTTADHERFMADADVFGGARKTLAQVYEEYYYPNLDAFHATVSGLIRRAPTVVLGNEAAASMVAEQHGLARAEVAPSSVRFFSRHDPPHPEVFFPSWAAWVPRTGRRLAMFYRAHHLRHGVTRWPATTPRLPPGHPIMALRGKLGLPGCPARDADVTLCLWPDWFAPRQRDWPRTAVTTGFPLHPSAPEIGARDAGRNGTDGRRIVATTGSVAGSQRRFYETMARACRILGNPAVFVTPHSDHIPTDLSPDIVHLRHASFRELFETAALVVHHGGIGTSACALAAGVPQLVMPMRGDQFDTANRLARLGVAQMISVRDVDADGTARAMEALLRSRRVAGRCRQWQRQINAEDGLRAAADRVEDLITGTGTSRSIPAAGRL